MLSYLRKLWESWLQRRERRLPLGVRGERVAERFLNRSGVRIITRNYRVPQGEIDLVGRVGELLVFVEVKTRRQGQPFDAVTHQKQSRVIRASHHFLRHHQLEDYQHRYDIVAVLWLDDNKPPQIEHRANAYAPESF